MEKLADKAATRRVIVVNPAGLHARPSLAVSQPVKGRDRRSKSAPALTINAADVLQLLSLGDSGGPN